MRSDSPTGLAICLVGKYYLQYLPARLVSSDIDVDRDDFLKRDTNQTGVAYGRFDLDWLISTCTVGKTEGGDLVASASTRRRRLGL